MPSARSTDGFTLPEVFIVILVIGVLAAIALPTFLGQADRGRDAAAKSDAASLASLIEQCDVNEEDFRLCDSEAELAGEPGGSVGLPIGGAPGQVQIAQAGTSTYRLIARSESGVTYRVHRIGSGTQQRSCAPANQAGCPPGGDW